MVHIKNGYPRTATNSNGSQTTTVYYSTEGSEIDQKYAELMAAGITHITKTTENGIAELEVLEEVNTDGESAEKPDTSYGAKTATLHGSLLSMALEQHPKYKTNWNHYLFCKDSQTKPSFWYTAKDSSLSSSDKDKYKWGTRLSDRPDGWYIIEKTKQADYFVIPTYVLEETARYRSFQEAAKAIGDKVGRRVSPETRISVKSGRDWLCEDARIQYDGKNWIGTLTYTLSGEGGWDSDLYD